MKKLIAIVMIICIMLCGCSKAPNEPTSTTPTTNIPTDVEKVEISPTEVPNEYTLDGSCDICHKTKKLKEYRYETVTYAVCEDCYNDKILGYESDYNVYDSIFGIVYIALTDDSIFEKIKDEPVTITYDAFGITCSNSVISDYFIREFKMDLSEPSKVGSYEMIIDGNFVKKSKPPKHPLAE